MGCMLKCLYFCFFLLINFLILFLLYVICIFDVFYIICDVINLFVIIKMRCFFMWKCCLMFFINDVVLMIEEI